jgi:outer membrane protein assembly factor BamB
MHRRFWTRHRPVAMPLLATWLFALSICFSMADWASWRGPHANGSVSTGDYPTAWSIESVSWRFTLPGKGGSTPIICNDRIYLTTPDQGQDAVLALNLHGKQVWITRLGAESAAKHRTLGSSCNASPVTDGKGIFVYFRSSRLAALELDGSIRWTNDLAAQFGTEKLFWDQGSSPVVTDDLVIMARLHQGDSWIAGFDKATGALRWQQKRQYEVPTENDNAYTTPLFFKHNGRAAFLIWGADHLTAHSSLDGSVLWTCGNFNPNGTGYWPAISSPVISGNLAIVPAGRDDRPGQAQIHAVKLDGSGDVTSTHHVWKRDDVGVFVTSLAEYQGRVYLLRPRGEIVCLDPLTGRTIWTGTLPRASASFYASPVIANGVLYAAREDGVVFAARVQDKFELLSENPMGERIVASPAVDRGRLLLRGDKHLLCIERR